MTDARDAGSFRDPSGFVYRGEDGTLYRQVNQVFLEAFERFHESGCYDALIKEHLLVPHENVSPDFAADPLTAGAVIRPHEVLFISYPYEWCFQQLRDAALVTLRAQEIALDHGMTLRDASAFNVQFDRGRGVLIDTLSFGPYNEGEPWAAYRQFCMHFLAPLACLSSGIENTASQFRIHLDGLPLPAATRMLPWRARLNLGLLIHLFLHARAISRYEEGPGKKPARQARVSNAALRGMIQSLRRTIEKLSPPKGDTHWSGYYGDNSYAKAATMEKDLRVQEVLEAVQPATVWDLGANTGRYARISADMGAHVVAFDYDAGCVAAMHAKLKSDTPLIPLVMDLANPSPALGWHHAERKALIERGPADLALALALVHHLAIANNVPLPRVARFLKDCGRHVLVEWVPKTDPMVQRLLDSREDIFLDYTEDHFKGALEEHFSIVARHTLPESGRVLYHVEAKG
jgi:ribosomal protein L11 methylase PrmA